MNKLKLILISILLTFIFASCSKKEMESTSYEFLIQEDVHSFNINWSFGTINFIDSKEFKIEESATDKIKESDKFSYSLDSGILNIQNQGTQEIDLNIYLDKSKSYKSINIAGISVDTFISKSNIENLTIALSMGRYNIKECKIKKLETNITCGDRYDQSLISDSDIEEAFITYTRIFELVITFNVFNTIEINVKDAYIRFRQNDFMEGTLKQTNGDAYLELNGNYGYTFDIDCDDFELDMETINYNNHYFYKSGERKIYIKNENGSLDIRRYFKD